MVSALIKLEQVVRSYQLGDSEVLALKNLSLQIERGEFVAITGPSGSGKSTFMNLCGCLDSPTSGKVIINNQNTVTMRDDARADLRNSQLGFIFQQFNLLARTSALENVALPLLYAGIPRAERLERAAYALEQVGMGDRVQHHPSQLSGGQQQRTAIARALVNKPSLLLADEPTGALDTQTGYEIMQIFQKLNNDGISIILVTHEAEIAAAAKRRLTFRDGELLADEPIEQTNYLDIGS